MSLIDGEKLQAYLDQINSFATNRSHAIRADGEDPAYFDGIRQFVEKVTQALADGQFDPDAVQTPVEDIQVETRQIVRQNDRQTSWMAAMQQTTGKRQALYIAIMQALSNFGPQTDEQLATFLTQNHIAFSDSGLRTRRSELVKAGWIEDSSERAATSNGGQATVWAYVLPVI